VNFDVSIRKGNTPIGRSIDTLVSFTYSSPKGEYEFVWMRFGRHNGEVLRLTDSPKTVWLQPDAPDVITNEQGIPRLQIVAIEGVEALGGVVAIKGENSDDSVPAVEN
jgi:hypothetical protein